MTRPTHSRSRAISHAAGILLFFTAISACLATDNAKKTEALASIERQRPELIQLSEQIWRFAETSLLETNSAKTLADAAERHGFSVRRGVADLPTAFIASFGQGKPIIGIVGEYDALPGLSQKASAVKEPLQAARQDTGAATISSAQGALVLPSP